MERRSFIAVVLGALGLRKVPIPEPKIVRISESLTPRGLVSNEEPMYVQLSMLDKDVIHKIWLSEKEWKRFVKDAHCRLHSTLSGQSYFFNGNKIINVTMVS